MARQGHQRERSGADFVELTKELATFKGASHRSTQHLPRKKTEIPKPFEEAVGGTPDGSESR